MQGAIFLFSLPTSLHFLVVKVRRYFTIIVYHYSASVSEKPGQVTPKDEDDSPREKSSESGEVSDIDCLEEESSNPDNIFLPTNTETGSNPDEALEIKVEEALIAIQYEGAEFVKQEPLSESDLKKIKTEQEEDIFDLSFQNTELPQLNSGDLDSQDVSAMTKTNAQMCREYRMRKKSAKVAEAQQRGVPMKKAMTAAERNRLCRLRKKNMKIILNESGSSNHGSFGVSVPDMGAVNSEPIPQPVSSVTNSNISKSPIVFNTIEDQVDENIKDSSFSPVTHDHRNLIIVQAQVHGQKISTFDDSQTTHTAEHCAALTSTEGSGRFRAERKNQQAKVSDIDLFEDDTGPSVDYPDYVMILNINSKVGSKANEATEIKVEEPSITTHVEALEKKSPSGLHLKKSKTESGDDQL
ncbi:hypothetical protein JTB14_024569 [Gonioctena quinquepunctata]|nr:hypothetical protein JTB14_024569 [Gonioctena quinquepunctata]